MLVVVYRNHVLMSVQGMEENGATYKVLQLVKLRRAPQQKVVRRRIQFAMVACGLDSQPDLQMVVSFPLDRG